MLLVDLRLLGKKTHFMRGKGPRPQRYQGVSPYPERLEMSTQTGDSTIECSI